MPVPVALGIGFAIQQIGLRALPVLLRSGQTAMRYFVTSPGSKGKELTKIARKVVGDKNIIDDISLLPKNYGTRNWMSYTKQYQNKALRDIDRFIDPKKLSGTEKDALMQIVYRDSAKILQRQKSYPVNAKLAKDIETGFGAKFDKVFSSRNFVAGDRTGVTVAKTMEKVATAPKQLPPPGTPVTSAAEIARARVSAGLGMPTRETLRQIPKVDRSKIIKLERAQRKIKTAASGQPANVVLRRQEGIKKAIDEARRKGDDVSALEAELRAIETTDRATGAVISEGLRGVGSAPKPAWWQGAIPSWLRVGGQPYKGAYPGAVSGERVLGATTGGAFGGGLLFSGGSAILDSMETMGLKVEGPPVMTDEQLMAQMAEEYKKAYQPTETYDANVILPSAIE